MVEAALLTSMVSAVAISALSHLGSAVQNEFELDFSQTQQATQLAHPGGIPNIAPAHPAPR
jgi:hypothetical protein